jgi:uncharacterized protein YjbI with pentapeptide repeats
MKNSTFKNSNLWDATFQESEFENVTFEGSRIAEAKFMENDLSSLNLKDVLGYKATFTDCELTQEQCDYLKKEDGVIFNNTCE